MQSTTTCCNTTPSPSPSSGASAPKTSSPANAAHWPPSMKSAETGSKRQTRNTSPFRFGPVFLLDFNPLQPNPAKTQSRDPNDFDGNIDGTRGRRVGRETSVNRRISGAGLRSVSLGKYTCVELRTEFGPWKKRTGAAFHLPATPEKIN